MIALIALIIALLLVVGAIVIYIFGEPGSAYSMSDSYILANFLLGVGLLLVIVFGIVAGVAVTGQNALVNDVTRSCADQRIDQRRQDTLLPQFKDLLVTQYPQYEREIFAGLKDQTASTFFARYPDLRVADAYRTYVSKLDRLNADIVNEEHARKQDVAAGKTNQDNPWYLGTVLKDVRDTCPAEGGR